MGICRGKDRVTITGDLDLDADEEEEEGEQSSGTESKDAKVAAADPLAPLGRNSGQPRVLTRTRGGEKPGVSWAPIWANSLDPEDGVEGNSISGSVSGWTLGLLVSSPSLHGVLESSLHEISFPKSLPLSHRPSENTGSGSPSLQHRPQSELTSTSSAERKDPEPADAKELEEDRPTPPTGSARSPETTGAEGDTRSSSTSIAARELNDPATEESRETQRSAAEDWQLAATGDPRSPEGTRASKSEPNNCRARPAGGSAESPNPGQGRSDMMMPV